MTAARFLANPESKLLLEALKVGLRLSLSDADSDVPFARAKDLGNSSGLLPWVLELVATRSTEAAALNHQYKELCGAVSALQRSSALGVMSELMGIGVPARAFKGVAYAASPHGGEAIANDVDILIPRLSVAPARSALERMGFSQHVVSHAGQIQLVADEAIKTFEATHYELFPFTKVIRAPQIDHLARGIDDLGLTHPFVVEDGQVYVAVELDIHHNLSHGIDASRVLDAVCDIEMDGHNLSQLDWETHIWFVAARVYHEVMVLSSRKLRPLVDIGRILSFATLDWKRVIEVSKDYALSPSLYYPLCWISEQLPGTVPEGILSTLDSDRAAQGLHDFGDFVPKMLGQKVLIRPQGF